jgi:hypothetical protein
MAALIPTTRPVSTSIRGPPALAKKMKNGDEEEERKKIEKKSSE